MGEVIGGKHDGSRSCWRSSAGQSHLYHTHSHAQPWTSSQWAARKRSSEETWSDLHLDGCFRVKTKWEKLWQQHVIYTVWLDMFLPSVNLPRIKSTSLPFLLILQTPCQLLMTSVPMTWSVWGWGGFRLRSPSLCHRLLQRPQINMPSK